MNKTDFKISREAIAPKFIVEVKGVTMSEIMEAMVMNVGYIMVDKDKAAYAAGFMRDIKNEFGVVSTSSLAVKIDVTGSLNSAEEENELKENLCSVDAVTCPSLFVLNVKKPSDIGMIPFLVRLTRVAKSATDIPLALWVNEWKKDEIEAIVPLCVIRDIRYICPKGCTKADREAWMTKINDVNKSFGTFLELMPEMDLNNYSEWHEGKGLFMSKTYAGTTNLLDDIGNSLLNAGFTLPSNNTGGISITMPITVRDNINEYCLTDKWLGEEPDCIDLITSADKCMIYISDEDKKTRITVVIEEIGVGGYSVMYNAVSIGHGDYESKVFSADDRRSFHESDSSLINKFLSLASSYGIKISDSLCKGLTEHFGIDPRELIYELKTYPRTFGWIPVEMCLPPDGVPVQVTYTGYVDGNPYCNEFAVFKNGAWHWKYDMWKDGLFASEPKVKITAWRPEDMAYLMPCSDDSYDTDETGWNYAENMVPPEMTPMQVTYLSNGTRVNEFAYINDNELMEWYRSNDDSTLDNEVIAWKETCMPYVGSFMISKQDAPNTKGRYSDHESKMETKEEAAPEASKTGWRTGCPDFGGVYFCTCQSRLTGRRTVEKLRFNGSEHTWHIPGHPGIDVDKGSVLAWMDLEPYDC